MLVLKDGSELKGRENERGRERERERGNAHLRIYAIYAAELWRFSRDDRISLPASETNSISGSSPLPWLRFRTVARKSEFIVVALARKNRAEVRLITYLLEATIVS